MYILFLGMSWVQNYIFDNNCSIRRSSDARVGTITFRIEICTCLSCLVYYKVNADEIWTTNGFSGVRHFDFFNSFLLNCNRSLYENTIAFYSKFHIHILIVWLIPWKTTKTACRWASRHATWRSVKNHRKSNPTPPTG